MVIATRNDQFTGLDQSVLFGNVVANDRDSDDPFVSIDTANGLTIPVEGLLITTAQGATLRIFQDGYFTYDPSTSALRALALGQTGTDTFTYERVGSNDVGTVTLTVIGTGDKSLVVGCTSDSEMLASRPGQYLFGDAGDDRFLFNVDEALWVGAVLDGGGNYDRVILTDTGSATNSVIDLTSTTLIGIEEIEISRAQTLPQATITVRLTAEQAAAVPQFTLPAGHQVVFEYAPATQVPSAASTVPTIVTNAGLNIFRGAGGYVDVRRLDTTDTNTSDHDLIYTLISVPQQGVLFKDWNKSALQDSTETALTVGSTFTQAELNGAILRYQHDNSAVAADSFVFTVSDGQTTTANTTFQISAPASPFPFPIRRPDSDACGKPRINFEGANNDDVFTTSDTQTLTGDLHADNGRLADVPLGNGPLLVATVNGTTVPAGAVGHTFQTAKGAQVTIKQDGTFTYNPNGKFEHLPLGQTDTDSFTYTNTNTVGSATVTITIIGADNKDVFNGTETADNIDPGVDNDVVNAGGGNDMIKGSAGSDTMDGGIGTDTVDYSASTARVVLRMDGRSSSGGDAQGDRVTNIENFIGSSHNDIVFGNSFANDMRGGFGGDALYGFGGNDRLFGEQGIDVLMGGAGIDELTGGAGADVFYFYNQTETDIIKDWNEAEDRMLFRGLTGVSSREDLLFAEVANNVEITAPDPSNSTLKVIVENARLTDVDMANSFLVF